MNVHPSKPAPTHSFSVAKGLALETYRFLSQPLRQYLTQRQRAQARARVMAYFYHRVGTTADSPLTSPIDTFRRQIDYLRDRYEMVSLDQSLQRIRQGNYSPSAHITFDDGYADNCSDALPYLIANRVPTTYFVSSWHILTGNPFEHDLRLGHRFAVNTPQQIRAMSDAGIEIGSHTRRHVDLGTITDEATLRDEIIGSKHELEDMTGRTVRYFAFPFGTPKQLTPAAIRIVREAGYEAFCSAFGGYNFPGDDPFHVQRIHGDNEMPRFKNWATMDPRKIGIRLHIPPCAVETVTTQI